MINMVFKKSVLAVMVVALAFAFLPVTGVFAAEENPPTLGERSNARLERIWAREVRIYERLGRAFDHSDATLENAQKLIDRAAGKGKDVTALQAALDAFEAAIQAARPQYDALAEIVNTHAGFDADGKVTDVEQARSTVEEVGTGLKVVKSAMGGTGKAFRQAIRAFREANKPDKQPTERDS